MNLLNIIDYGKYVLERDDTNNLFSNITLYSKIDKDVCINAILDKNALLEPCYAEYDFLKLKIEQFFLKYYNNFAKIYEVTIIDYEPLENLHRKETETRENKYTRDSVSNQNNSSNSTDTNKVSPFDTNTFINDSQLSNDTTNTNKTIDDIDDLTNENIIRTSDGSIGVMTSQAMFNQEIEVRLKHNVYDYIANMFCRDLMLRNR